MNKEGADKLGWPTDTDAVSTGYKSILRAAFSRLLLGLMAAFLLSGVNRAAAQEEREAEELPESILGISKDEPEQEESAAGGRPLLNIDFPNVWDDEPEKQPEQADQTSSAESELWQIVQQLQRDFEMLKEEIAQLRSELRSVIPEAPDEEPVAERTVNPFWISDAEIEKEESG